MKDSNIIQLKKYNQERSQRDQILDLVKTAARLKAQIKSLQSVLRPVETSIKEFMDEDSALYDQEGLKLVSYTSYNQSKFDDKLFLNDYNDLGNKYLYTTKQHRLTIHLKY